MSDKLIGRILHDTHRIIRRVGQGGMGAVYEAEHVRLSNKRFAIKVLHGQALEDKRVYARFRREAQIATELGHPNIIDVTDFYETRDGLPCMVMELLRGKNLEQVLRTRERLHPDELRVLMAQVGGALQAAHDQGVVHRDLKPANIFLSTPDGEAVLVKLLDFGISKIRDSQTKLTGNRDLLGTPHYMSPEQGSGEAEDVDQATDIFALGIICYEALTGRLPFDAPTMLGVIYKICNDEPPPPSSLRPELPEALDQVLARALAKAREVRYGRVFDFVRELDDALRGSAIARAPEARSLAQSLAITNEAIDALGETLVTPETGTPADEARARGEAEAWLAPPHKQTTMSAAAGEASLAPSPRGGRARYVALLLAALVTAGGVWWSQRGAAPGETSTAGAPDAVVTGAPARPDAATARPDAAPRVTITLELTPPSARVLLDGTLHEERPLSLAPSHEPLKLLIEAQGHRPRQLQLIPDKNQRLVVALQPVSAGRRTRARKVPAPTPATEPTAKPKPKPAARPGQEGFDKL